MFIQKSGNYSEHNITPKRKDASNFFELAHGSQKSAGQNSNSKSRNFSDDGIIGGINNSDLTEDILHKSEI